MKFKRDSNEKYQNELKIRKTYSVIYGCGHRLFISPKRNFAICHCCGRKHLSPREVFKLRLKAYLKKS